MEKDYSFATEYAKSSRASCKACKDSIPKDSLRMAIMVQSHHFDGKIPNWFHYNCFFKKAKVRNVEEIKNIDTLRWEDQVKIKSQLSNAETNETSNDLSIEYSKSNRSKCAKCELKIDQGGIKFSVKEDKGIDSKKSRSTKLWYHISCLTQMKKEIIKLCPDFDIEKVNGFTDLEEDDQSEMRDQFKSWKSKKRSKPSQESKLPNKKAKTEEKKLDEKLKKQSQLLWDVRDKLNKEVAKNALAQLLEYNKQFVPRGEAELLNSVADCMVFGCLAPCPECRGILSYSSNRYKCRTMIDEWTKCLFETREVNRRPFAIPKEFLDLNVLKNYIYKARVRILPKEAIESANSEPLKGFSFVVDKVVFDNEYNPNKVIETIRGLGGVVTNAIGKKTIILISSKKAVNENRTSLVDDAKSKKVNVVSADFMDNLKNESLTEAIGKHSIVDWGRSKEELENLESKSKAFENKSVLPSESSIQVFTVKGGAAVDPDSDLQTKAHLYQDPKTKDPLNAILGMTDLAQGSNSFYKLQLLESDKGKGWWVFRAWGRIGTNIGGNKVEKFHDLSEALRNFHDLYLDKTGNHWENRAYFRKHPYKFVPIDVDYGEDVSNMPLVSEESKLPVSVQDLIRFVFDMESMKKTMLEFELDLNKMPLGKLSKKQIDLSYGVLRELQEVLMKSEKSKTNLHGLSNKFYTTMPHNFGLRMPPLIDTLAMVKEKCEMIDSLMEIEVAYKLMTAECGSNTVDNQYEKLHNRIEPLGKDTDEYRTLKTYLQNTHAPTHNEYKIKIKEIYNVTREGESDKLDSFKNLPNRMMLWHGSRRTNFAGILSQGLRIAPPEAPVQGYMFGKGIYFADMVSKSANYCYATPDSPDGLLMLCEVVLGNMSERYKSDSTIVLKKGEHSCKGIGATRPDPTKDFVDKDGIVYPMGKPVKQKIKSDLLYNEYIVYDIGQVRQRYLFHVHFKF